MKFLALQPLEGPNLHSRLSVLRVTIDWEDAASPTTSELQQRAAWLPEQPGWRIIRSTIERYAQATPTVSWGALLGSLAASLEEERFHRPTRRIWVEDTASAPVVDVMIETGDLDITQRAARVAARICQHLATEPDADACDALASIMRQFWQGRSTVRFNWITAILAAAARDLDVPATKLLPNRPFLMLGQGFKRKRMMECIGDGTSALAASLSKDKVVSHEMLRQALLPVPPERLVTNDQDLEAAIESLTPPLVVKGRSTDKGTSVTTGITTRRALNQAIDKVRALDDKVLIQCQIPGDDYRFTLIYDKVLAVARRTPAHVVADGTHSVADLVAMENLRRRQSGPLAHWFDPIQLDTEALSLLENEGLDSTSIPATGTVVRLSGPANLSQGGSAEDVTDIVHPSIIAQVERAARVFDLNIAGLDVITTDITKPLEETRGAFIEINASPGLRPHYLTDVPREIGREIIDQMFPVGDRGRIPTVGVTGTNGKTTTCRMITRILEQAGTVVGTSTTAGITIGGVRAATGDRAGGSSARVILQDPLVEAGVFELARGGILRRGVGIDDVEVSVVTNVTEDHLGQDGLEDMNDLARVKGLVAEIARTGVVLNAENVYCEAMASRVTTPVWWIAQDPTNSVVAKHLLNGGNAVVVDSVDDVPTILHRHGDRAQAIIPVDRIPATLQGTANHNTQNALCAAAAALALDIPIQQIHDGLARFDNSVECSPGRLNIRDVDGIRLIYDYVHNVAGMQQLGATLSQMNVAGKRMCVLSHEGLRTDDFYRKYAATAASSFDVFIVTEDPRGPRAAGEVLSLLRDGLSRAGVEPEAIHTAPELELAVATAYSLVRSGDLLLLTGGFWQPSWEFLDRFNGISK